MIAGIDLSSFFVDIVYIDTYEDVFWERVNLGKVGDAFDRSRGVLDALRASGGGDALVACKAIGIEDPRGMNPGPTFRVQGAVLQFIPREYLVYPWVPSQWRKAVGLPGNCKKEVIMEFVKSKLGQSAIDWPQDACDAWCVAEATRLAIKEG